MNQIKPFFAWGLQSFYFHSSFINRKLIACLTQFIPRIFESLEKLANHVSIAHSSVGYNNLYYCKWEGCQRAERGFNARYKMLVHCRTHTKEKPHFCSFRGCEKAFSRAENLKIHYRSHTNERPYRWESNRPKWNISLLKFKDRKT